MFSCLDFPALHSVIFPFTSCPCCCRALHCLDPAAEEDRHASQGAEGKLLRKHWFEGRRIQCQVSISGLLTSWTLGRALGWALGGPSLMSRSEHRLPLGLLIMWFFLPGETPYSLHWASPVLTTLPIACCHTRCCRPLPPWKDSLPPSHCSRSVPPEPVPPSLQEECLLAAVNREDPGPSPNRTSTGNSGDNGKGPIGCPFIFSLCVY